MRNQVQSSDGGWQYAMDFRVQVRAMPPGPARISVWDPLVPVNVRSCPDPEASSAKWSVWGQDVVNYGDPVCTDTFTGSGQSAISGRADAGNSFSLAAGYAHLSAYLDSAPSGSMARECTNGVSLTLPVDLTAGFDFSTTFGSNLVVPGGITGAGTSGNGHWVAWSDTQADPAYDANTQPQ